ncbi:GyrI-like domain-containing protein [Ornithinicoccus halotolerans]|uniref:GyrI-like domain-containing protein n=1 Tax=Ornithinicoccus halotolerans TaxID=1748220 RepID=UPI0012966C78|nr:GyrI-like domain-containing protein [Ornithinicoccus halotolerans]
MDTSATDGGATTPRLVTTETVPTAVVRGDAVPMTELTGFYDRSFGQVSEAIESQGLRRTTAGLGRYFGQPTDTVDLEVGFGTEPGVSATGDVVASTLPGGRAAQVTHVGGYEGLGESWQRLYAWIDSQGLAPAGWMWEEYVTMPTPDTDPATIRTVLTWPLAD